jgi:hypothetical protein
MRMLTYKEFMDCGHFREFAKLHGVTMREFPDGWRHII